MTKFEGQKIGKKAVETGAEDKRRTEGRLVWNKTWWGIITGILFILLLFLGWRFRGKIKIEVSNCYVALITVGFTYIFLRVLRVKSRALKFIFGLLWLLLLPNTAYLFTSLGHIVYQWNNTASLAGRIILLVEYLLMGLFAIIAFIFSFSPFEIIIEQVKLFQGRKVICLILFNFLVAFGLVLGRFEHINSYVVFTDPLKVIEKVISIFVSFDLLKLVFLFGLLCSSIYFLFRGLVIRRIK